MNRNVTFGFFVAAVVAVGIYFFRMVQPFLLPLLMAGTLALLVQPVFERAVALMRGRRRVAAVVVCTGVVLLVVIPVFLVLGFATQELIQYGGEVVEEVKEANDGRLAVVFEELRSRLPEQEYTELCDELLNGEEDGIERFRNTNEEIAGLVAQIDEFEHADVESHIRKETGAAYVDLSSVPVVGRIDEWLSPYVSGEDVRDMRASALAMGRAILADVYEKTSGLIQNLVGFFIGFAIMLLAFYYFLAEGPTIAKELESVLPFEQEDEVAVVKQFETICRGVVLGTLVAAIGQAILLGGALAFLRIPGTWLLTCLTVVLAMIPFVGAGGIYVPVAAYLLWNGKYGAAIFLLVYGMVLVSTIDNLIRAHMIHGTSRLHPLMALISALGALKLVGLWGIFVGPVVAGIFYALLKILQRKLKKMDRQLVPA